MKWLYIIAITLLPLFSFSQPDSTNTDTCDFYPLTEQQIIDLANKIDSLERQDSIKTELIAELKVQLTNYIRLSVQNNLIIDLKNTHIDVQGNLINLQEKYIKVVKKKWTDSKVIWFVAGVATIVVSSWAYSNVVQ